MNFKYTDASNTVAFRVLDNGGMESCLASALPAGTVIDPADIPDPKIAIQAQIDSLERQELMPRATREFMLLAMEAQASAEVLAVNPGYVAVKAFDLQIAALRAQL